MAPFEITIGVGLALLLALLGAGVGLAMTATDAPGFLVARLCFYGCAIDVIGFAIYLATRGYLVSLPKVVFGAAVGLAAVGSAISAIQWINYREAMVSMLLRPANDPTPIVAVAPDVPKDALQVFLGSNVGWSTKMPHTVLQMAGQQMLTIDRKGADISVTTLRIFDQSGGIIARIDEDGFWTAEGVRRKKPNPSTLIVYDRSDEEVLSIRYLNRSSLKVSGVFRNPRTSVLVRVDETSLQAGGMTMIGSSLGNNGVDLSIG